MCAWWAEFISTEWKNVSSKFNISGVERPMNIHSDTLGYLLKPYPEKLVPGMGVQEEGKEGHMPILIFFNLEWFYNWQPGNLFQILYN